MNRLRFESLETREMFAAATLADSVHTDADGLVTLLAAAARTESVGKDEKITIGRSAGRGGPDEGLTNRIGHTFDSDLVFQHSADFDNDGDVDGSDFISAACARDSMQRRLLPYVEQDNLYKFSCSATSLLDTWEHARFIRVDTSRMTDLQSALDGSHGGVTASLVASEEYFSLVPREAVYQFSE